MWKHLSIWLFAVTALWATKPPALQLWVFEEKGKGQIAYAERGVKDPQWQGRPTTITVKAGTPLLVSSNATLESGDSWYEESHYLYVFKNAPVNKVSLKGSLPSQVAATDTRDIFQLRDNGGKANPNVMDPARPGVSLQWIRRGNVLIPATAGVYTFTTWARSRLGAAGKPSEGTPALSVTVEVTDTIWVRAKAAPLTPAAKIWFVPSEAANMDVPMSAR